MKKYNFALFSDAAFFTLCAFLISFTFIRFYLKNALTALILSLAAALAVGVLSFIILYSKRSKRLSYLLDESEKKSLSLHLSVCSASYVNNLFLNALEGAYMQGNRLETQEHCHFFNFKMAPLSADDVADVIRTESEKKKLLYCSSISPDALSLAGDFDIGVKTIGDIYLTLKERELLPEKYALGKVKKKGIFKAVKLRFNRKLCPSLFFCGLTLFAFSFFTFYPVYYIISGAVLTALSAACLFFG